MLHISHRLRQIVPALLLASYGMAATVYYVDFTAGSDANSGNSPAEAFKHSPGDAQADGAAAAVKLAAGDTVRFKGGVAYYGMIQVKETGTPDQPIVYDGNSDGSYGTGPAIIDGATPLTGWRRCTSAADAHGNPNWRNIFVAEIKATADWRKENFSSEESLLAIAQDPKPSDIHFRDRPAEFYKVNRKLETTFPGELSFEQGTRGNRTTPLAGLLVGRPTVVEPIEGGAVTITFNEPVTINAVGIESVRRQVHFSRFSVFGDGKSLMIADVPADADGMQRHELGAPVTVRKLTYRLLAAQEGVTQRYTRLIRLGAFTPAGENLLAQGQQMVLEDEKVLTAETADAYDGMSIGFKAGNNTIFYRDVEKFDPATHRLYFGHIAESLYRETEYAFFNSAKLIGRAGEYSLEATGTRGTARIHFWPKMLYSDDPFNVDNDKPTGIGHAVRANGFQLNNAANVTVQGFKIRRTSSQGILARDSRDIRLANNSISMAGGIGLQTIGCERVVVADCSIDHSRDRGILHRSGKDISTLSCRVHRNGLTGIGHYGVKGGTCGGNIVTENRANHANGLTFYLGCADMIVERNEVYNGNISLTIQEAENMLIRNNILDGNGHSSAVGIWVVTPFRNVRFLNNALINGPRGSDWSAGVFSNNRNPEELVFRNNIIDGLAGNLNGTYENNLYTSIGPYQKDKQLGQGELLEEDLNKIFVDPAKRDYRLRPGSPAIGAGQPLDEVVSDFSGKARPAGKPLDIGPYVYTE